MKLNYDCIRNVLLVVESEIKGDPSLSDVLTPSKLMEQELLKNYSENEVLYHVSQLSNAGYLKSDYYDINGTKPVLRCIKDLTWDGHELLNNIRDNNTFNKAKRKILDTVGSGSIAILSQVAQSLISQTLGL